MKNETHQMWFGPLSMAPTSVRASFERTPTFAALMARGWIEKETLLYAPPRREGYNAEIGVVGRMFAWDDRAPVVWLFTTIGMCRTKPQTGARRAFRHFELVFATNNAERDDPFPSRLGVALSQGDLPGWDWSQVRTPPLIDWLAIAAQEIAALQNSGDSFAIGDALTIGPGKSSWTKSILNRSVILPASPHMLLVGLSPFNTPSEPIETVEVRDWFTNPGTDRFEYGFYWLLPVSEPEYVKANREGVANVFADLVEQVHPDAQDDCAVAFDLLRGTEREGGAR